VIFPPTEPDPVEPDPTESNGRQASSRREASLVLVLMAAAAGVIIFATSRTWETVRFSRVRPLSDLVIEVTGRKVEAGITPQALVVLAAILAILATGPHLRRAVGGIVAFIGCVILWRGIATASGANHVNVSSLISDHAHAVGVIADSYSLSSSRGWAALVAVSGALIVLCGGWVLYRAARWPGMSSKYDAPARPLDGAAQSAVVEAITNEGPVSDDAAWTRLDRGEDPTLPKE
jgi:uncharacterized membrane protein (TIGR02234 family)